MPLVSIAITQDRQYFYNIWTLTSLDAILALVGGFVGLIWSETEYILGFYEEFRFSQEIISEIYSTTDASRMKQDQ